MHAFEFDQWKDLAQSAPADFEEQRLKLLRAEANAAPKEFQPALHALVGTLCVPQQGTPLERALNAHTLMVESFQYLQEGWTRLATEMSTSRALPFKGD